MNRYLTLIKREFWEFQGTFVRLPIVVALLISLLMVAALGLYGTDLLNFTVTVSDDEIHINNNHQFEPDPLAVEEKVREFPSHTVVIDGDEEQGFTHANIEMVNKGITFFFVLFSAIMMFVGFYYLLSCLYTDRKDNSILFWKSLPVSETHNVLCKLIVATLVLPTIAVLAALAVSIVYVVVGMVFIAIYSTNISALDLFSGLSVFTYAVQHWFITIGIALWGLPVYGWLMFSSAAAHRSPFLLAILPPAALALLEKILFGSELFIGLLDNRISGIEFDGTNAGYLDFEKAGLHHFGTFITSPGLWVGIAVAIGFISVAIWLRNNRYEV